MEETRGGCRAEYLRGLCADTVVVVTRVALSFVAVDSGKGRDVVGLDVGGVGRLQGTRVLGLDGGENVVGALDGGLLGFLVDNTGVGSRVEKNESILSFGNGGKVTLVDGALQGGDLVTVDTTGTSNSGGRDGTIGGGDLRKSGNNGGTSGNLSKGNTTVDLSLHYPHTNTRTDMQKKANVTETPIVRIASKQERKLNEQTRVLRKRTEGVKAAAEEATRAQTTAENFMVKTDWTSC